MGAEHIRTAHTLVRECGQDIMLLTPSTNEHVVRLAVGFLEGLKRIMHFGDVSHCRPTPSVRIDVVQVA